MNGTTTRIASTNTSPTLVCSCRSSTEVSTFSNFSAYFKEGIRVQKFFERPLSPRARQTTSQRLLLTLLTNRRYGIGEHIGRNALDEDPSTPQPEFCDANGFYWDGIISSKQNVREFLFNQAGYQLLDFTIKGGLFGLPLCPV